MNSIRVKNLRCLVDTGYIPIKPLTILLGANSTGKSTFLRVFPLLKQSIETPTNIPILWYGEKGYVDFGTIKNALRDSAETISFGFKMLLPASKDGERYGFILHNDSELNVEFELMPGESEQVQTRISKLCLGLEADTATFEFDAMGKVTQFSVNDLNLIKEFESLTINPLTPHFIPFIEENHEFDSWGKTSLIAGLATGFLSGIAATERKSATATILGILSAVFFTYSFTQRKMWGGGNVTLTKYEEKLFKQLNQKFSFFKGIDANSFLEIIFKTGMGHQDNRLFITKLATSGNKLNSSWQRFLSEVQTTEENIQFIRNLYFAFHIPLLLLIANKELAGFFGSIQYIAPLRTNAQRYYRFQDTQAQEIDFQGENLPIYLDSLSPFQKQALEEWLKKYFGIQVSIQRQGMHLEIMVREQGNASYRNLADTGFGYSQALPVITKLWALQNPASLQRLEYHPSLIAIEQPELHLHPQLQAQLADVFANIFKKNAIKQQSQCRLLVETHSETIITRIGELIEYGQLAPEDVQVVLFEPDRENGDSKVRLSGYNEEGCLTNWPYGFFQSDMD